MPTPIGHTLVGLAVWAVAEKPGKLLDMFDRRSISWIALCVLASNLPDADFIWIGERGLMVSGKYHHGISHSIGFALAIGFFAWMWASIRGREQPGKIFGVVTGSYGLHLLLDIFSVDTYAENGIGLPLFWPLSDTYVIIPLLSGVDRTDPFSASSLTGLGLEIAVCGALLLAAVFLTRRTA